jgi:TonB family protein
MLDLKTLVPKFSRDLPADPRRSADPHELKQRRLMAAALALLLVALSVVLYHDRNFWFPDAREAEDQDKDQDKAQPQQTATLATSTPNQPTAPKPVSLARKKSHTDSPQPNGPTPAEAASSNAPPPMSATTTRTVLPPLEIEVVAGNVHRTVHPGTNSVHVDLQAGSPPQRISDPPITNVASDVTATAASVTSNAAERVQMSAGTAEVVSQPVKPGYPLLARQMKVQGSVILQALIGRDGLIQDLRVLSGPPILASAAQEAVKQWHFKPHFQGAEPVETQARITVNFTISTN